MRILDDFYKVGYIYEGKPKWAVYFNLESAQEAMVKMIRRGLEVTELKSQKFIRGDNLKGVHRTPRVRD